MKHKKRQIKPQPKSLFQLINDDKKLTVPNILTAIRLLAIPFLAYFIYINDLFTAVLFGVPVALTDALDGWTARHFNQKSELGKVLDPLADKMLYIFVGLAMVAAGYLPVWFYLLVVARDVIILFSAWLLVRKGIETIPESRVIGKLTFGLILLAVLFFLFPAKVIILSLNHFVFLNFIIVDYFLLTVAQCQIFLLFTATFFVFLSLADYGLAFLKINRKLKK